MRGRWKIILAGSVAVLLLVATAAIEGVYRSGLGTLTTLPEPPPTDTLSDAVTRLAWLEFEGAAPISVQPTGPLRYAAYLAFNQDQNASGRREAPAGLHLAAFCARHIVDDQRAEDRRPLAFGFSVASLSVWMSRHWSTEQIIACALNGGYYGHGFIGIEAAARGYLEKPMTDLSHADAAILMVALRGGFFDPVCNPAVVLVEANELLARLTQHGVIGGRTQELIIGVSPDRWPDAGDQCSGEDGPTR